MKPSLQLLSSLTDEHVLRALMAHERLTRAELATETGISRPTISESVRRLDAADLVRDTGVRTTGRGRVGSYYALAPDLGGALVVGIAPEGVVAEVVDVRGAMVGRSVRAVPHTTRSGRVRRALDAAVVEACDQSTVPVVLSVVSAADPVDRESGRLIHLVRIAVLPQRRGQAIGVRLLADVVEFSRVRGADLMTLNTQSYNTDAQRLYEWFGFRRTGERQAILRFDL